MGADMNKYSRICWNTKHWHEPTGEAFELEKGGSYVSLNGFGHEEWLFNFAWLQPGPRGTKGFFRYGFLQPIGKYREKYQGKQFDVFLYTVTPDKYRLAVGIIRNLYVPTPEELEVAYNYMERKGWLDQMADDLSALGIDSIALEDEPASTINVRYRQSDVEFFDPKFVLPEGHVTTKIDRYQPLNWNPNDEVIGKKITHKTGRSGGKKKSENDRTRAAIKSSTFSPRHDKLQNALFDYLQKMFGKTAVQYEQDFVDIQLRLNNKVIFFEVKIALTAKSCIRDAFGQLLEYSMYPSEQRATELIVVGEGAATDDDHSYLKYMRSRFSLPIRYIQWDWEKVALSEKL